MKLVVDITPHLFDRLKELVDRDRYRNLGDFAVLALENQLSLESLSHGGSSQHGRIDALSLRTSAKENASSAPVRANSRLLAPTAAVKLTVDQQGWIWGIVNRILPIKFAARQLSLSGEPLPLALARERIAGLATILAHKIDTNTSSETDRHDTLVTGFPVRDPLYPAQQRFGNHYVGRMERSGETRGALFELGLAGIETAFGEARVGITEAGLNFARLENPVLDQGSFNSPLAREEIAYYIRTIVPHVPRELDCFITLLNAISESPKGVEELDSIVRDHLSNRFSAAAIQTQKAGALGRLRDLGLVERRKDGLTAQFRITSTGESALRQLIREGSGNNGRLASPLPSNTR